MIRSFAAGAVVVLVLVVLATVRVAGAEAAVGEPDRRGRPDPGGKAQAAASRQDGPAVSAQKKEAGAGRSVRGEALEKPCPPHLAGLLGLQPLALGPGEAPWRPATSGPFVTFTAPLVARGHLVLQPLFFYNWVRGTYDADSHFERLPAGNSHAEAVFSLFMQYGLLDNVEIDLQLNAVEKRRKVPGAEASSLGIADTQIMARYSLWHETSSFDPEVSLLTQVKVPTGKYQDADPAAPGTDITGNGSTELTLGLDLTKAAPSSSTPTSGIPGRSGGR